MFLIYFKIKLFKDLCVFEFLYFLLLVWTTFTFLNVFLKILWFLILLYIHSFISKLSFNEEKVKKIFDHFFVTKFFTLKILETEKVVGKKINKSSNKKHKNFILRNNKVFSNIVLYKKKIILLTLLIIK